eukprot:363257-Chlamydomonas_euryale.AAC.3
MATALPHARASTARGGGRRRRGRTRGGQHQPPLHLPLKKWKWHCATSNFTDLRLPALATVLRG